jgi:phosphatidylserine decarboxylase
MFTTRTLLEGKWVIMVLLAGWLAMDLWCPARWALTVPLALLLFVLSFFRDPRRAIPADAALIVSPADGKVVEIRKVPAPEFMSGEVQMVAIFLSVFNVHVQRAPVAGLIKWVKYQPGKFLDARNPDSGAQNEARAIGLEMADGTRVVVRQIAGLIARRIVGWAGEGVAVAKGDRIGMIRFGSRVELYLPATMEVTVAIGQTVAGGKDVLARKR